MHQKVMLRSTEWVWGTGVSSEQKLAQKLQATLAFNQRKGEDKSACSRTGDLGIDYISLQVPTKRVGNSLWNTIKRDQ